MTKDNPDDTFRILVATDIHLGYQHERNKGQALRDSFTTFEEILQYGKKYQVDFILLGGDLFHDTKPSQAVMVECMDLLRKYCYGSGDVKMECLTEPSKIFEHCHYKNINYEDPNMNINMPIFSIHGNHDDPNFGSVGSMDILSVTGLINYFGKWMTLDKINVEPIVLKKGSTYISLYGLGFVNDQRLNRIIKTNKLILKEVEAPKCFNILVLHQNRVQHSINDFVPEHRLPEFLNLVIWGHEHACRIDPESVPGVPYFISQPGSSIATSLCHNETLPKHVGLLSVNKLRFKMKKLKLNTVRPFVLDTIHLYNNPEIEERKKADCANPSIIINYVDEYIEHKLLPEVLKQLTGHPKQPKEPLLRLRVLYKDEYDLFETTGLGQKYCDEVLNPMSMILFRKISDSSTLSKDELLNSSLDDVAEKFQFEDEERGWTQSVQGSIKEYFDSKENRNLLTVLSVGGLNETLTQYIVKADEDIIQDVIHNQISKTKDYLNKCNLEDPDEIISRLAEYRDERNQKEDEECQNVINFLQTRSSGRNRKRTQIGDDDDNSNDDNNDNDNDIYIDDSNDEMQDNKRSVSAASKGRGKKTTSTRGRASSRGATKRGSRGSKTISMNKSVREFFTAKFSDNSPEKKKQSTPEMQSSRIQRTTASSSQSNRLNMTNIFLDDSD